MESPSRILVLSAAGLLRPFPTVLLELLEGGIELFFSGRPSKRGHEVPEEVAAHERAREVELPLLREGVDALPVTFLRSAADALRFLDPRFEGLHWPRTRTVRRFFRAAGLTDVEPLAEQAPDARLEPAPFSALTRMVRELEGLVPANAGLVEAIRALEVDGVLLVSRFSLAGDEPEVVKAARVLGIPSALLVWSWDNLSSKSLLHERPDHLLVWNDVQRDEAEQLHGFDAGRVHVCGAANFDRFFEAAASVPQPERGQRATIVYLGSSLNVATDEPALFGRWLAAVRSSPDKRLRDAHVVVRPHPGRASLWRERIAPNERLELDIPEGRSEPEVLARLLVRADLVVALNTSGEIEAAIADRPVITYRAGADAPGQEGSLHFTHLLEANGGFVIDGGPLSEHVARLGELLAEPADPTIRRQFVEAFVRPRGLAAPVAPIVAATVRELLIPARAVGA